MRTETDIVNSALLKIGDEPLQTLSEQSAKAARCRALYPEIRDEVIRMNEWASCVKRRYLDKLTEIDPEYADLGLFGYALPPDSVRFLGTVPESNFILEGSVLYVAIEEKAIGRYLYVPADATQFDNLLVKAISIRLAAELAVSIKSDLNLAQLKMSEFQAYLLAATRSAGAEGNNEQTATPLWTEL